MNSDALYLEEVSLSLDSEILTIASRNLLEIYQYDENENVYQNIQTFAETLSYSNAISKSNKFICNGDIFDIKVYRMIE